jgi:hypothetical protein
MPGDRSTYVLAGVTSAIVLPSLFQHLWSLEAVFAKSLVLLVQMATLGLRSD